MGNKGKTMKKLLFLLPLILLTACDNTNIPKCWNQDSIEALKGIFWKKDGVKWHIKNITETFEIPGMVDSTGKYRYCSFEGTLTNGETIIGDYKVYKTISKKKVGTYTVIEIDSVRVE